MTAKRRSGFRWRILATASLFLMTSGCSVAGGDPTAPAPTPASTLSLEDRLEELPGVDGVERYGSAITVSVSVDASDDEVFAIATSANEIATGLGDDVVVDLVRAGAGYDEELDMLTEDPWRVTVFPTEDVERVLTGVLWVEDLPGVTSTVVSGGWASVRIDPAVDFGEAFGEVAATYPFSGGASYTQGSGEHLMIVHIPERTTVEAVQTIAGIAAEYPTAEFVLQSPTEGPMWPHLLVAHLDAEQGASLDARLREPDLADADPEGFAQQFQLTVVGPDGPTYIAGTLGDVPR
jgi:hypothetical protein